MCGPEGEAVSATVLREVAEGRYLIQFDPPSTPHALPDEIPPHLLAFMDQSAGYEKEIADLRAKASLPAVDVQEPFEVSGDEIELYWDDDDGGA